MILVLSFVFYRLKVTQLLIYDGRFNISLVWVFQFLRVLFTRSLVNKFKILIHLQIFIDFLTFLYSVRCGSCQQNCAKLSCKFLRCVLWELKLVEQYLINVSASRGVDEYCPKVKFALLCTHGLLTTNIQGYAVTVSPVQSESQLENTLNNA